MTQRGRMCPHVTMLMQVHTPRDTHRCVHSNTSSVRCTSVRVHTHTRCDCKPGPAEKVEHADTRCILFEKWDTLQPPDPQPLTSPFQTAFLLLSEADKFIPLVSKQSPLFFCRLHQWKEEGGSREGGRNTSAPQSYTVGTGLMSCVLEPLGLGVWAPLSYNTVDKKPRAQPSGNLRGGVSRPGGQERGKEGQNISGTLHLRWPTCV